MCTADLKLLGGFDAIKPALVELTEGLQMEGGGEAFCASTFWTSLWKRLALSRYSTPPTMPQLTIQQAFDLALQHHQAGRLQEAEQLYRQILNAQPNHADALHLLGVIAHQTGNHAVAVELIRKAISLNPTVGSYHNNLGNALKYQGRLEEAIASFQRALGLKPDYAED